MTLPIDMQSDVGVIYQPLSLCDLPDELQLHVLYFLDIPELLSLSRVGYVTMTAIKAWLIDRIDFSPPKTLVL